MHLTRPWKLCPNFPFNLWVRVMIKWNRLSSSSMTWKYKLNSYLVEPVRLEWTIEVWFDEYCVFGIKVVSVPEKWTLQVRTPQASPSNLFFLKKLSINKQSAFASDWLSHFNIWWVESWFEQNPLRYVLKKRRGKMARQSFRNNCWLLNSSMSM